MERKTLRDVLSPGPEDTDTLRWRVTVPLGTNPLLLIELFQFGLAGAGLVLVTLCAGVRVMDGGLTVVDIAISLRAAGVVLLGIMSGFWILSTLFFGNRYFALYHMDGNGIYYEGSRGNDASGRRFYWGLRSIPVQGTVTAVHTSSRVLPWEKARSFQNIASMRVFILRRGFWHMMRVYTPDAATHERVAHYLARRLQQQ